MMSITVIGSLKLWATHTKTKERHSDLFINTFSEIDHSTSKQNNLIITFSFVTGKR